jgi:hypothetical protein
MPFLQRYFDSWLLPRELLLTWGTFGEGPISAQRSEFPGFAESMKKL